MKLTVFAAIVLLVCSLYIGTDNLAYAQVMPKKRAAKVPASRPVPSSKPRPRSSGPREAEIDSLRARFDLLDAHSERENSKVQVWVTGANESTGKLTVNVETATNTYIPLMKEFYEVDLGILSIPEYVIDQIIRAIFSKGASGSLDGVKVKQLAASGEYEVVEDYTYQANGYKITIPKGFVYDRATIPRAFWLIMDKDSLSNVAPLFHDMLYRHGGKLPQNLVLPYRTFSRDDADKLFLELMTKCGVVNWRSKAAYEAVRNFAESHWNGR